MLLIYSNRSAKVLIEKHIQYEIPIFRPQLVPKTQGNHRLEPRPGHGSASPQKPLGGGQSPCPQRSSSEGLDNQAIIWQSPK